MHTEKNSFIQKHYIDFNSTHINFFLYNFKILFIYLFIYIKLSNLIVIIQILKSLLINIIYIYYKI